MIKPTKQQCEDYDTGVKNHIVEVAKNICRLQNELSNRTITHDASKFGSTERDLMAVTFPRLAQVEYGSKGYQELLTEMKAALDHHYSHNSHHPEFYENGVDEMDLVDLIELICDWKASTLKNVNGDIFKSIEINTKRFNLSPQLVNILTNTVKRYLCK